MSIKVFNQTELAEQEPEYTKIWRDLAIKRMQEITELKARHQELQDMYDEIGLDNLKLVDATEEAIDLYIDRDANGMMKLMEDSYKVLLIKDKS